MPILVWFVRKADGLPDDSMPEQILQTVDEAVELVQAHKAGAHGDEHILRVFASGGALGPTDHHRLVAAGAEVLL
jgi:hypothetical protein